MSIFAEMFQISDKIFLCSLINRDSGAILSKPQLNHKITRAELEQPQFKLELELDIEPDI